MAGKKPLVGIVMGSDSDWPVVKETAVGLKDFGVEFEVRILSAHRTPDEAGKWAKTAERRGLRVLIAAAGKAAHLAGVIAAHTTLPVIGIPMESSLAGGLDSLLSMTQMPGGIPVLTMSTGKSGAQNAAIAAVQILALADERLAAKLKTFKKTLAGKVRQRDRRLQKEIS